jgi:hypothetical protein
MRGFYKRAGQSIHLRFCLTSELIFQLDDPIFSESPANAMP